MNLNSGNKAMLQILKVIARWYTIYVIPRWNIPQLKNITYYPKYDEEFKRWK